MTAMGWGTGEGTGEGTEERKMIGIVARERPTAHGMYWHRALGWLRALLALLARDDPQSGAVRGAAQRAAGDATPDGPHGLALEELYERHARTVLAYLYARLPTPADAEDALADVYVAALAAHTDGETLGAGWLMRVAVRRVADFYRERQRRPILALAADSGEHPIAGPGHDPEEHTLRGEERRELLALVARLPEEQREVLALRFAAGMRSREIAVILGRSDEATRALLSRALRRLRKEWVR